MNLELRNYQQLAVDDIIKEINNGKSNPLVFGSCGSGKSIILSVVSAKLAEQGLNVVILSPRKAILRQSIQYFKNVGVLSSGVSNDIDFAANKIIIGTTQTVIKRHFINGEPDIFIIDEAHLHLDLDDDSECATRKYLSQFKGARYVGFTATPFRKNSPIFGSRKRWKLVNKIDTIELLREGYLSPIRSVGTLSKKIEAEDDEAVTKIQLEQLSEKIVNESCRLISSNGRKRTLVFARDRSHAELLENLFNKQGYKAKTVISSNLEKENQAAVKWFRENKDELKILISINMLLTGVDIPEVDCLVLIRNFSSYNSLIQCLGRGLRKAVNKTDCIILDFGSRNHTNISSFIVYGEVQQRKSSSYLNVKACKDCGTENKLRALNCSYCNAEFSFRIALNDESRLHEQLLPIKTQVAKVIDIKEKIEKNTKVYYLTCDNDDVVVCARKQNIEIAIGATVVYEKNETLNILLSSS